MIIAIDFGGCVAKQTDAGLVMKRGAPEALASLKRAGHVLLLYSSRTNRALQHLPEFDPLVANGTLGSAQTDETRETAARRDREMRAFVAVMLPGVFDAIDDGRQGKPVVDLFIDNKAVAFGGAYGMDWPALAALYGEPE